MSAGGQLPLGFRAPAEQRFEHFLPGDAAAPALLRRQVGERGKVYLHGPEGSGKTHLLRAMLAESGEVGLSAAWLPLAMLGPAAVGLIDAQPAVDLVCIDDLDALAGHADAERALFALHNRQHDARGAIVYAARVSPDALDIGLPDLRSRLSHCLRLTLQPLDEAGRRQVLAERARARGLLLEDAALDYLFRRVDRDLGSLTALLDRLDQASLAAQRRITVPFLRAALTPPPRAVAALDEGEPD